MKVKFWFKHGYNEKEVEVFDFPEGTDMKKIEQEYYNWFYEQRSKGGGIEGGFDIQ